MQRLPLEDRKFIVNLNKEPVMQRTSNARQTDPRYHPPFQLSTLGSVALCLGLLTAAPCRADLPTTLERVKPAVVGVGTLQKTRTPAVHLLGTGFAISDGLHVITNAHVVAKTIDVAQNEAFIVLAGQGQEPQPRPAQIVAVAKEYDLALLKIGGAPLPALTIGDSETVREGQAVAFTGFPIGMALGLYPATHRGTISAITPIVIPSMTARQLDVKSVNRIRKGSFRIFQLDATAYPGNSGSPLYDPETGEVYGIVNMVFVKSTKEAVLSQPSGISYAIPASYIKELLSPIKQN